MTLTHPRDLEAWRRWQASRQRSRRLVHALRRHPDQQSPQVSGWLATRTARPTVLVALDTTNPTSRLALLDPALMLPEAAVLSRTRLDLGAGWNTVAVPSVTPEHLGRLTALDDVAVVAAAGHYTALGGATHAWSRSSGARFVVVQHGLLTPHAPPLPPEAHLLAWTRSDADYWRSGRDDVSATVTGSALLARAADQAERLPPVSRFARPTFLGQLHSAELGRASMTWAATEFCRRHDATYRPHPTEVDAASRVQHRVWERLGITLDRSGTPLLDTTAPVVSVFSTGVLEAAAAGIPAWVSHPSPPAWLQAFWQRHGLRRWGEPPTPAPPRPVTDPVAAVAAWLDEATRQPGPTSPTGGRS